METHHPHSLRLQNNPWTLHLDTLESRHNAMVQECQELAQTFGHVREVLLATVKHHILAFWG